MIKFKREEIISFFEILNTNNINYILLRNLENELPDNLSKTKDIDIIVHLSDKIKLEKILIGYKWSKIRHPFSKVPFLYSMTPFDFYNKNGLHIDVAYELACRSIISREWIPLDQKIQEDLWKFKIKVNNAPWSHILSVELEILHLLTRCIFDKKGFNNGYIQRICEIFPMAKKELLSEYLSLVFFKFHPVLLEMVCNGAFNSILNKYLTFKDY